MYLFFETDKNDAVEVKSGKADAVLDSRPDRDFDGVVEVELERRQAVDDNAVEPAPMTCQLQHARLIMP